MTIRIKNWCLFAVALVVSILVNGREARADIVFQANGPENNYVPFGEDGTPGRPVPGDKLGNTITLAGTNRLLDRITVNVALNNDAGTPPASTDTWTLDLYLNDGDVDPASGLGQPNTLIATVSTTVVMPPFSQPATFSFTNAGVVVPDSFTVIISSSHPTDTFFMDPGVAGPFSSRTIPSVGDGVNTMWYTSAAAGWETNSTWAIADGATTNFMFMTVEASPAP